MHSFFSPHITACNEVSWYLTSFCQQCWHPVLPVHVSLWRVPDHVTPGWFSIYIWSHMIQNMFWTMSSRNCNVAFLFSAQLRGGPNCVRWWRSQQALWHQDQQRPGEGQRRVEVSHQHHHLHPPHDQKDKRVVGSELTELKANIFRQPPSSYFHKSLSSKADPHLRTSRNILKSEFKKIRANFCDKKQKIYQ